MDNKVGKYLTFLLGDETYGIPIKKVKEIIGMMEITHLPKAKDYAKGVINLRGKIIPVCDLRLKFGLPEKAYHERTCIVVMELNVHDLRQLVGMIVDTVSEVVNIQEAEIEPPPDYGTEEGNFLTGIGKLKDRVILMLDIDRILSVAEITLLSKFHNSKIEHSNTIY